MYFMVALSKNIAVSFVYNFSMFIVPNISTDDVSAFARKGSAFGESDKLCVPYCSAA
jgi:hypothetical protein